ncbi:Glycerophosphodiester phosphodiesterase, cytoplasmic [Pseudoclavibacter triregionum]|nr:Glycerophosphodiester phosphodiesterase, cytoplasmic [Pseudoclavibacter triregionum]
MIEPAHDEWFSPAPPRILAHRGLALGCLENSIPAFRSAAAHGVRHMETDVRATRDGVAVLWHDEHLGAFDGTDDLVAELSFAQLRDRAREGRAIPSVAEALEALPDLRFNLDVKAIEAAAPLAAAVRAAGAEERVLVCSFSDARLAAIRRLLPECASSASAGRLGRAFVALEMGRTEAARRALGGADAIQVPEREAGITLVSPVRIERWKRVVREIHVWTVNDPDEMRRLWDAGVDGIVTDRADLAVEALA